MTDYQNNQNKPVGTCKICGEHGECEDAHFLSEYLIKQLFLFQFGIITTARQYDAYGLMKTKLHPRKQGFLLCNACHIKSDHRQRKAARIFENFVG